MTRLGNCHSRPDRLVLYEVNVESRIVLDYPPEADNDKNGKEKPYNVSSH